MPAFSILYRIEWVETADPGTCPAISQPLSVSCIGSNGLKPFLRAPSFARKDTFSILYRIEWVETTDTNLETAYEDATFSILYRIEWVETGFVVGSHFSPINFQYPVSDRMG